MHSIICCLVILDCRSGLHKNIHLELIGLCLLTARKGDVHEGKLHLVSRHLLCHYRKPFRHPTLKICGEATILLA